MLHLVTCGCTFKVILLQQMFPNNYCTVDVKIITSNRACVQFTKNNQALRLYSQSQRVHCEYHLGRRCIHNFLCNPLWGPTLLRKSCSRDYIVSSYICSCQLAGGGQNTLLKNLQQKNILISRALSSLLLQNLSMFMYTLFRY